MGVRALPVLMVLIGFVLPGCNTTPYKALDTIPVPSGVTTQQSKYAILAAIYATAPKPLSPGLELTDQALQALFPYTYQSQGRRGAWFVEDIRPNSVLAGFDNGKHYLRVEYVIGNGGIAPRIDGSRNLKQSGDRIHDAALQWMGTLESRIRANLGAVASIIANDRSAT